MNHNDNRVEPEKKKQAWPANTAGQGAKREDIELQYL